MCARTDRRVRPREGKSLKWRRGLDHFELDRCDWPREHVYRRTILPSNCPPLLRHNMLPVLHTEKLRQRNSSKETSHKRRTVGLWPLTGVVSARVEGLHFLLSGRWAGPFHGSHLTRCDCQPGPSSPAPNSALLTAVVAQRTCVPGGLGRPVCSQTTEVTSQKEHHRERQLRNQLTGCFMDGAQRSLPRAEWGLRWGPDLPPPGALLSPPGGPCSPLPPGGPALPSLGELALTFSASEFFFSALPSSIPPHFSVRSSLTLTPLTNHFIK